jgi:hypothetical protein
MRAGETDGQTIAVEWYELGGLQKYVGFGAAMINNGANNRKKKREARSSTKGAMQCMPSNRSLVQQCASIVASSTVPKLLGHIVLLLKVIER